MLNWSSFYIILLLNSEIKKVTRRGARTHDHKIKSLALYQTELGGLDDNFAEMRECIFVCFGENQYERYLERSLKEIDKLIWIF